MRNVRLNYGVEKFGKLVLRGFNHRNDRSNRIASPINFNKTVDLSRVAATRNQFSQSFRPKVFEVFADMINNRVFFRYNRMNFGVKANLVKFRLIVDYVILLGIIIV